MCGIVAAVAKEGDVRASVLKGLKTLEYRGYDSAGMAVLAESGLEVRRKMGKIANLEAELDRNELPASNVAIAHTRWATHGVPADRNAHPHCDDQQKIVVVHNGIIENYLELRAFLAQHGHEFHSDTDTEVLANLIAYYRAQDLDLHQAVRKALSKVEGAYGLVVMSADDPGTLIVARLDSPLVVGVSDTGSYAASDMPALLHLTRDFLILENRDTAVLTAQGQQIFDVDGNPIEREILHCDWTPEQAERGGYPHFMLKEIYEQPDVLARTAFDRFHDTEGDVEFEKEFTLTDEELCQFERLRFMAMGTSLHAAQLGQKMLGQLAKIPGETLNASEFLYSPELEEGHALTVVVSQSGETADTLRAMREVQKRGGRVLGICNVQGSTLAREADDIILTHCGPEVGVASTKAFFGQVTALYLLAIRFGRARKVLDTDAGRGYLKDLRALRHHLDASFRPEAIAAVKEAAKYLATIRSCLFLGRSMQHPVALEGALKLKEVSYIHAEGYPAGEMKHGPIALIDKDFPIIAIATPGITYEKMLSTLQEVRARSGKIIAVAAIGDTKVAASADYVLPVPEVPELLAPLVTIVPLQLLSYEVALALGRDIDQPRNLAKSVTVE
ncbi:MAG: glutamine--fructose-6-phosphate transaminase (isomerizing) [Planctomycetota bacterium]|nr:glutamine--fructose-6-phosphate transaminase (isomerizing) [Planctomycetota bacterium]MDA1114745.1 glutamine--fructose-6-phosphate transaminase (isomerizing) [Planctomycetota bacterium]